MDMSGVAMTTNTIQYIFFNRRALSMAVAVGIGLSLLAPFHIYANQSWYDTCVFHALYSNRSIKQRLAIASVAIAGVTLSGYTLYRTLTRTIWEKNILALEAIEDVVQEQFWHRVKTHEIETRQEFPNPVKIYSVYAKKIDHLTLLSSQQRHMLFIHMLTAVLTIHNSEASKAELAHACELQFSAYIQELKEMIKGMEQKARTERGIKSK
jgi:hypothetical protein